MSLFSKLASRLMPTKVTKPNATKPRFADIAACRDYVIAALKRQPDVDDAVPNSSDPAKFDVTMGDRTGTGDVTNIFGHLTAYPDEDVDTAVARLVRSVTEPKPETADTDSVVVVIRDRAYIDQVAAAGIDLYHEPLGAGLFIVYMLDRPDSMIPLARNDVQQLDVASLRNAALGNVRQHLGNVVADHQLQVGALYFVEGNTMLSTSLILVDAFWESIKARFPGDVLIALPRRDQLFVFDAADPQAEAVARRLIDVTFRENFNLLSPKLYARRGGQIVSIEN